MEFGATKSGHWGMRRKDQNPTPSGATRGDEDAATRRQGRSTGIEFMTDTRRLAPG